MKTAKIIFNHPVSGKAFIQSLAGEILRAVKICSNENDEVDIPLKGLPDGLWQLIFEWEYDGRLYSINRNLLISHQ